MSTHTLTDAKVSYGAHMLARLPERFPAFEAGNVSLAGEPVDAETLANLNEHFQHFCKPAGEHNDCIMCGQPQSGWMGHFKWGLAHGHGACSCGWPATAYHFIKDSAGKEHRIVMVLQAHPDGVVRGSP